LIKDKEMQTRVKYLVRTVLFVFAALFMLNIFYTLTDHVIGFDPIKLVKTKPYYSDINPLICEKQSDCVVGQAQDCGIESRKGCMNKTYFDKVNNFRELCLTITPRWVDFLVWPARMFRDFQVRSIEKRALG
jgi:hypothetical protein